MSEPSWNDFLNLAAAWKTLREGSVCDVPEDDDVAQTVKRVFFLGAHSALCVMSNITERYEGEAFRVLAKAVWQETGDVLCQIPAGIRDDA